MSEVESEEIEASKFTAATARSIQAWVETEWTNVKFSLRDARNYAETMTVCYVIVSDCTSRYIIERLRRLGFIALAEKNMPDERVTIGISWPEPDDAFNSVYQK